MALRVIAGRARGRRLRVPSGGQTRPTSGLVRGALLNMVEQRGWLAGATVLDPFAGSGAVGIEALSRDAGAAIFVESDPAAVRALRTLARRGAVVDGVVADPPYGAGWVERAVDAVAASGLLAPDAWIAVEHRVDEPPTPPAGHAVLQARRHGRTAVTLVARAEDGR
jgi:16S rRNA (guanine966-N2)-methyltransferase